MMKVAQHHLNIKDGYPPEPEGAALSADGIAHATLTEPGPIEWQALRLRFFAARDRRSAGEDPAATRVRLRGSFDGCAAVALTAYDNSKDINLDASSNGKPAHGTSYPVADVNGCGERGWK